jgi:2-polyprenyl-3-methyl-5-hydroxy-6-metoxy-1,4-benzoquinol methylase
MEAQPERERGELREYLGADYDEGRLRRWREILEEEMAEIGDEPTLYRTSDAYLYNLTAFAMTGTKIPYLRALKRRLPPGSSLLDYGCGIGSDGLLLLEAGYRVAFADFDNPSTRYLRWRLAQRGLTAPVYDLDRDAVPTGFDAAYAFDVIEHVDDPWRLLAEMESRARMIAVNLLEDDPSETSLHRTLPIEELTARAARMRLLSYSRHYGGRSHLVLYVPEDTHGLQRLRSRAIRARGRIGRPQR